jgi:hypothetical protein
MWIMVAGPYSSGGASEDQRQRNLGELNKAALAVFERGHVPLIGVNLALPIIELAGPARFEDIVMPVSLALSERCDACLRIGGASVGADQEVDKFKSNGRPVFHSTDDIPFA